MIIVSIGLTVALPKISTMTLRQHVDRSAYVVASDMRSAFTSAARGRVPVRVVIRGDTSQYTLTNTVTGETILKRGFGFNNITIAGVTSNAVTMVMFPNGVATGIDTLTVSAPTYSRKISVSRVGFVRVLP